MAIAGYADFVSVRPGGTLNLYVSTDAPKFRTEFYRIGPGAGLGPAPQSPGLAPPDVRTGVSRPAGGPSTDWGWQPYPYTIPSMWTSGVYVCFFVECDANGVDLPNQPLNRTSYNGPDRKAMFVVRAPAGQERRILFKVPTATYAAYNYTGGGSTYNDGGNISSLRRPGLGTGGVTTFARTGTPYYQLDWYDQNSDRMNLVHLESPFIAWLEGKGYQMDYCSDFDFEVDPSLPGPYQLMLSVGHDEYWSDKMRAQCTAFLQRGGNIAFFSGNTCYKFIDYPAAWQLANRGLWANQGRPEDQFTGVSYIHGGGRWDGTGFYDGPRQVVGYQLQLQDHWALRSVASPLGDVFPDTGEPSGCIGYEVDGARATLQNGVWVPTGAPVDFFILGQAALDGSWQDPQDGTRACTIGLYTSPGVALTVGSVDWPRVAFSDRDPSVSALTRNVIDALSVPLAGWTPLGSQITSAPAVVRNQDGRLEVFGRGYDGAVRHAWQLAANGPSWSAWAAQGGALAGNGRVPSHLSGAANADGRLAVAARFADSTVQVITQTAPNNGWGAWVSLTGNVGGDPVIGRYLDGRLAVFVRGYDGIVYYQVQSSPNAAFGSWNSLPENAPDHLAGNFAVAANSDGRLQLFARGNDHALWTVAQATANGAFGSWVRLGGGVASDPAVGANADGRLEVFAIGPTGHLLHAWQLSPGGTFAALFDQGGSVKGNPAIARNQDGRLEVFARGTDGAMWRLPQNSPNNGWGPVSSLGGSFTSDPGVGITPAGLLDVFAAGPARSVWHRVQRTPGVW